MDGTRSSMSPLTAAADQTAAGHGVSEREALRVWLRVALLSFGGPTGQIAVMHRILVEEKRWISETRFLHALNYCMLLPGPEAQQLATYVGWLMHRTRGGIIAGGLFIVPGILSIMALSYVYAGWGRVPIIQALFFGLKAAVLAIVLEAGVGIGPPGAPKFHDGRTRGGGLRRDFLLRRSVPVHRVRGGARRISRRTRRDRRVPRRRRARRRPGQSRGGARRQPARRRAARARASDGGSLA